MRRIGIYISVLSLLSCSPRIKFNRELAENERKFQDHIGLMVFDPQTRKNIVDFNSEKYFTPASNTKIFTLLSSLQIIGDSIPALKYVQKGDSLIFWGTGDPSFLYSEVFQNSRTFNFLKHQSSALYFSASNFYQDHFGPGWAWDDYNYSYSAERSPFPIYGNCLDVNDTISYQIKTSPVVFKDSIARMHPQGSKTRAIRSTHSNLIDFYPGVDSGSFKTKIPFHTTPSLIATLLSDTLKRDVVLIDIKQPSEAKAFYSVPSDSLYKVMMQESDNFIAEQLLQLCAGLVSDSLKSEIAIKYVKEKFLFDLPDEPQWVDGSGLSRYNLFTPRSIVRLWEKILALVPEERLFKLLAIGGEAGTIKNLYKMEPPYIFGKTGTLSNNHCLSGYLITKKEKVLIFSFMNNNYTIPSREVRKMMDETLLKIHDKY